MQKENEHTTKRILALFKKYGVRSVSMDTIASELGISKKTLYERYQSKDHLIEESISFIFKKHFLVLDSILNQTSPPIQKVIEIYHYGIKQMMSYDLAFYAELRKYHPDCFALYQTNKKTILFDIIKELLEEAQQQKDIRKDINLQLFCELHLYKIDEVIASSEFAKQYAMQEILDHLVIHPIRGILTDPTLLE